MRFSISVVGDTDIAAKFMSAPSSVNELINLRFQELGQYLQNYVQEQKLSGQSLNRGTGELADSITFDVQDTGSGAVLNIGPKGVPYAAIQERGGTTSAHEILPNKVSALHFFWGGKEVFFKVVNHPGSRIKATGYMRDTLTENQAYIRNTIANAVNQGLGF